MHCYQASHLGLGTKERMEQQSVELERAWGMHSTYIKPKDDQKTVFCHPKHNMYPHTGLFTKAGIGPWYTSPLNPCAERNIPEQKRVYWFSFPTKTFQIKYLVLVCSYCKRYNSDFQ